MLFGRFYINNYHANYNSYFLLKDNCLILKKKYFHICTETAFGASVSQEICPKSNPITQCRFKTYESVFSKVAIYYL